MGASPSRPRVPRLWKVSRHGRWGAFMTHRVTQSLLFVFLISGWFLITAPLAAQDSTQPAPTKSSATKSKKAAPPTTAGESADSTAKGGDADKTQSAKTDGTKTDEAKKDDASHGEAKKDEALKKEEAPPSPKLIEVPQDDATYTVRPKTVAVFVFTDGTRIESDDYLITKDALFINKDGQKTRYPINTVDRAATKATNQGRGVDIVFPKSKSEFNLDF